MQADLAAMVRVVSHQVGEERRGARLEVRDLAVVLERRCRPSSRSRRGSGRAPSARRPSTRPGGRASPEASHLPFPNDVEPHHPGVVHVADDRGDRAAAADRRRGVPRVLVEVLEEETRDAVARREALDETARRRRSRRRSRSAAAPFAFFARRSRDRAGWRRASASALLAGRLGRRLRLAIGFLDGGFFFIGRRVGMCCRLEEVRQVLVELARGGAPSRA